MTDRLVANLDVIRKKRPRLYARMTAHFTRAGGGEARLAPLGDGYSNLFLAGADGRETALYPSHPSRETDRALALSPWRYPRILVIDGFALGYHVRECAKTWPVSVADVLVVEKSFDAFAAALKDGDWTEILADERYEFFIGLTEAEFRDALTDYFLFAERLTRAEHVEHLYFEPALARDGPYYVAFADAIQEAIAGLQSLYTTPGEDNYRALANVVRNRGSLRELPLLPAASAILSDRPVAIVGAGPSLTPALDGLRRYRDRMAVIAADAALKPLLANGVIPDAVVSMERVAPMRRLFDGLPSDFAVPLFTLPSIHPDVLNAYPGPALLLKRKATFGEWLWPGVESADMPLGVSTAAYAVAAALGAKEFYLFGQNLAYDEASGASHVAGVSDYVANTTRDYRAVGPDRVAGEGGIFLETTSFWKAFHAEFEALIPRIGRPCWHVIEPGRGAVIRGARRLSPDAFFADIAKELPSRAAVSFDGLFGEPSLAHLPDLLCRTKNDLAAFVERVLRFAETVSLDFHDRVDLMTNEELWPVHRDFIARWEQGMRDVIASDARGFYFFLNCLFSMSHLRLLSEREKAVPERARIVNYMLFYSLKTGEWCREAAAWAMRAKALLERYG